MMINTMSSMRKCTKNEVKTFKVKNFSTGQVQSWSRELAREACYLISKLPLYTNISNTIITQSVHACIGTRLSLIPSLIMNGKKKLHSKV